MEFIKSLARFILQEELDDLNNQIPKVNSKEVYYNTKYPKVNIFYKRTDKLGTINIDVRQFLNYKNCLLPIVKGITDDEKAFNCLTWVMDNIKYVSDKVQYGLDEYWDYNYETLNTKCSDCEGMSILLYCIMRHNNIPYWKIRVTTGNVDDGKVKGGHCWVSYFCEETNKWVLLDCCYHSNKLLINQRKDYKGESYYKACWFSFNENYSYAKDIKDIPKYKNVQLNSEDKKCKKTKN